MAEENATPAVSAAPVTAAPAQSQPAVVATEASPSISTTQAEVSSTPVSETTVLGADAPAEIAPLAEPPSPEVPAETPAEPAKDQPVVDKPTEAKQVDGADKPQPEVKDKEESSQSDEPAPLPSFEWQFPEDVTVDQEKVKEVNELFGKFAVENKLEAGLVQQLGQKLIDRHSAEIKKVATLVADAYEKTWRDQTKNWRESFEKDPEIGGKRQNTTVEAAKEFIRRHGGTPEQQTEIRTIMDKTGLGNHPALIRLFAKATVAMREPKAVPATSPPPQGNKSRTQKFYGKKQ